MDTLHFLFALVGLALGGGCAWILANARFAAKTASNTTLEAALREQISTHAAALDAEKRDVTELRERAVRAESENKNLQAKLVEHETQLRSQFKDTASTLFEDFSKKFSTESEKKIGELLNPLRERIGEFQKKIDEAFTTQGKETHSLRAEIQKIVLQTDGLTKALRGDVKAQGNWGEVMLERILEESGLRAGEDYVVQASGLGLTSQDGGRLQPDVIVHLPEQKHIIIDSKVSLTAYERYCNETSVEARDLHLKEFLRSLKAHINGLEAKRYQDIDKLNTPDFVMMFLPIEGAYSLAVQHDRELHSYAWGKKIVLVCPATLFASLRTIASLWRIERQNQNAQEIARQGGALYDKFAGFLEDMGSIGTHLDRLHRAFEEANKKLHTGRGNLLSQSEKLKQMGAKTSKSLPRSAEELPDMDESAA
jgi:DNA recombination protein RmuC